jgi:hypothetical protein
MTNTTRCGVCGVERDLPDPCPCGLFTLEDVFGPLPYLKVPSLDEVFGADARLIREARETLGRVEGILRAHAEKVKGEHPNLWASQIEGVRAELGKPNWQPNSTLMPLFKMLSPHKGLNKALNLLPYHPSQYQICVDFRNAFMHDDWAEVQNLGGAKKAYVWVHSLEGLVNLCVKGGGISSALLQIGGHEWPWPT